MNDFWGMLWPALLQGIAASLLALPLAIATGWGLIRVDRRAFVVPLCLLPLLVSPVLLGHIISHIFGNTLFSTSLPMVLGQVLAILPWMSLISWHFFHRQPRHSLKLASSLGLPPQKIFWQMILPAAAPGIGLAVLVGLCQALTDFSLSLLLGGNIAGHSQNPALLLYQGMNSPEAPAWFLPLSGIVLLCGLTSILIISPVLIAHLASRSRS